MFRGLHGVCLLKGDALGISNQSFRWEGTLRGHLVLEDRLLIRSQKAQGVCRLLNDKILEIGLTVKILTAGGETYFVVSASDERLRSEVPP